MGDPLSRDRGLVAKDLQAGYISPAAAVEEYGLPAEQVMRLSAGTEAAVTLVTDSLGGGTR